MGHTLPEAWRGVTAAPRGRSLICEPGRRLGAFGQGGLPQDLAEVAIFLASPGVNGLTGSVFRVIQERFMRSHHEAAVTIAAGRLANEVCPVQAPSGRWIIPIPWSG